MSTITNLPLPVLGLLIVAVGVATAVAGLLVARRLSPRDVLASHHDITGAQFQVIGTLYAVLLAFIVITVWQRYDGLSTIVEVEAAKILDLHSDARQYPDERRQAVDGALRAYVGAVVEEEWSAMGRGDESPRTQDAFERLWATVRQLPVADDRELAAKIETLRQMNDLAENRHLRLLRAHSTIPAVLWVGLLAGGALTVMFSYFFAAPSLLLNVLMTASFAGIISLFIFVIVILDAPFASSAPVSSDSFTRALRVMSR